MNEFDTLLLRHVFWNRPDEAERVHEWLLNHLAADHDSQQIQYLLSGNSSKVLMAQICLSRIVWQSMSIFRRP